MRPFTQRGIDVENVCAVPCRPVGRMWGQTFPRAFPRPCLNRLFRDPAVAPSRRRSAGHPSPLFRQAPAEQARAQIARMDKASMGLRSWMELAPALERSLAYARSWNPDERAAEHSGIRITWGEVVASLEKLKAILPRLDAQPELLEEGFQWLSVAPEVKFTGYYSPVMQASRTRKPGYEYPIYRPSGGACPGSGVVPAYAQLPRGRFFAGDQAGRPVLQPGGHRSGRSAQEPESWKWRGWSIRWRRTI